jgi:hypothetical protein
MVGNDWTKKRLFGPFGTSSPEDTGEEFANMSSGASAPKPLTPKTAQAMTPQASPQYTGQEQAHAEAIDDGKQAPIAASRYLSYKDDPTWKAHDAQSNDALSGSGGFGAAILDRLTHGYYSSSKANQFQMATAKKNEIEKRYYNQSVLDEAAREKFGDQAARKGVYDKAEGKYYDEFIGSHGTVNRREANAPTGETTDKYGNIVTYEKHPGMPAMVSTPGFPLDQMPLRSVDFERGASEAANKDAKLKAEAEAALALARDRDASAKKTTAEIPFVGQTVAPGATHYMSGGRSVTAPLIPSQIRGGRGTSDEDGDPTFEDDLRAVQKSVSSAAGKDGMRTDTDTKKIREYMEQRGWDMNTRQKRVAGAAPAQRSGTPEAPVEWEVGPDGRLKKKG